MRKALTSLGYGCDETVRPKVAQGLRPGSHECQVRSQFLWFWRVGRATSSGDLPGGRGSWLPSGTV